MEKKEARLAEISELEALEGFWQDSDNASKIQKEKSVLESTVNFFNNLKEKLDEFEVLIEFADQEGDEDSAVSAVQLLEVLGPLFEQAEQKTLLSEETDPNNAICSINAGAGGTESCDWAQMLRRMIIRFSEKKGFKVSELEMQPGDGAGIKSSTLMIEGPFAYGTLRSETGIHRLVRISPFDANKRRHTSFASLFITPEVDDDINIEVQDKDIKIDVFRSGGAGGQSVNTTDSAVRITHHPSGIVVTCQNERSQLQNKQFALKILKSRLYDLAMQEKQAKLDEQSKGKKEIGWGSQIRSYVLHPYKMVKDHRTDYEVGAAEGVLDGDLDGLVKSYLQWSAVKGKGEDH